MNVFGYVFLIILFAIPILIFDRKKKKGMIIVDDINRHHKLHFFGHVLISVYFSLTFLAFAEWHTPWYLFSRLHLYGLLATFILPFALAYLVKGTGKEKLVAIVMAIILFISPLTRPFILAGPLRGLREYGVYRTTILDFGYAIPLNICNISAIIYLLALLLPAKKELSRIIKGYMLTIGFFGGLVNNLKVHNEHVDFFWYYFNWESYIVHALIMIIPMYMVLTNQIEIRKKYQVYNLVWLVPTYFIMGFLINPLTGFNYWFTTPVEILSFLPQDSYLTLFGSNVYPVYMMLQLTLAVAACAILYISFELLDKKIKPYFTCERSIVSLKSNKNEIW